LINIVFSSAILQSNNNISVISAVLTKPAKKLDSSMLPVTNNIPLAPTKALPGRTENTIRLINKATITSDNQRGPEKKLSNM